MSLGGGSEVSLWMDRMESQRCVCGGKRVESQR